MLAIRPASLADAPVIARFRLALLQELATNPVFARLRDDVGVRVERSTTLHLASGREITYLAFEGRNAIGMIRCLEARGSPLLVPTRYGYVASAFVARPHRRKGVLRKLMDAATTWARARGLTELRLHSTPENAAASVVWERMGFATVEHLRRRELSRAP